MENEEIIQKALAKAPQFNGILPQIGDKVYFIDSIYVVLQELEICRTQIFREETYFSVQSPTAFFTRCNVPLNNLFPTEEEAIDAAAFHLYNKDLIILHKHQNDRLPKYKIGTIITHSQENLFMKSWGNNVEEVAQLYICLNHMIWKHYETNETRALEYDNEWRRIGNTVDKRFSSENLSTFYSLVD